jgi:hypothetical protein
MNSDATANREDASSPSHDQGAGDHDQPYRWDRPPSTYLAFRQVVRLTILRSKLEAVRLERLSCSDSLTPAEVA